MKRHAKIGDRIVVVVQKQRSLGTADLSGTAAAAAAGSTKVRRGDIRHAIVVRTKKKYGRPDGSFVRFDDNACVLINKAGEPIGTRLNGMLPPSPLPSIPLSLAVLLGRVPFTVLTTIIGVVGEELRKARWSKILSLAPMHI